VGLRFRNLPPYSVSSSHGIPQLAHSLVVRVRSLPKQAEAFLQAQRRFQRKKFFWQRDLQPRIVPPARRPLHRPQGFRRVRSYEKIKQPPASPSATALNATRRWCG
jgi:hypothetical protein